MTKQFLPPKEGERAKVERTTSDDQKPAQSPPPPRECEKPRIYTGPSPEYLELMGIKDWKGAPPLPSPESEATTVELDVAERTALETDYAETREWVYCLPECMPPEAHQAGCPEIAARDAEAMRTVLREIQVVLQKVSEKQPEFLAVRDQSIDEQVRYLAYNYLMLIELTKEKILNDD